VADLDLLHLDISTAQSPLQELVGERVNIDALLKSNLLPKNARSICWPVLPLVSKKGNPLSLARFSPSSLETCLLSSRSHLLPENHIQEGS